MRKKPSNAGRIVVIVLALLMGYYYWIFSNGIKRDIAQRKMHQQKTQPQIPR